MGRTIAEVISRVSYLKMVADPECELNAEIEAKDIGYYSNTLHLADVVLFVDNPRLAFAQALLAFPEPEMGRWTNVDAMVADNTYFNGPVQTGYGCKIGSRGFGYERDSHGVPIRIPHVGNVVFGKDVELGNNVCIDRGTTGSTEIGSDTKIDNLCHIAHNVKIGRCNTIAASTVIEGSCVIGDNNTFGSHVTVLRKVKIGNHCIIGSGSVVTKDVEDYSVMAGNPARVLRKTYETKTA